MALTLLFLGRLEDAAGSAERVLTVESSLSRTGIAARLEPDLAAQLLTPEIKVALNGTLVPDDGWTAGDGDEVAFLPPVSGG